MTGFLARLAAMACLLILVTACTGSEKVLDLESGQDQDQAAASAQFPSIPSEATPPGAVTTPSSTTAVPEIARVHFAPIVGAPVDKVEALSKRLVAAGSAQGVRLVSQDAAGNAAGYTHEIKGYFSAFSENGSTTVIHVWDVITPSGQRVHRIQGQETVPGVTPDPWASVTPATMEAIADKVIAAYAAWLKSGA
jgi:hypothetical protein